MPNRTVITSVLVTSVMLLAGYGAWLLQPDLGDLFFPICAARAGFDTTVYSGACEVGVDEQGRRYPLNPITTALLVWPLAWLPDQFVAMVFVSLSTGLLAWGLIRTGERWRLLLLLSSSFWNSVYWAQWSTLILAAWYLPWLWPLGLLAKPHVALPVVLLRWRLWPWGVAVVAIIGLLSLLVSPAWPWAWLESIGGYGGRPALLTWYGPLLLLALLRWRDEHARFFLLASLMPMRSIYDLLLLFALPRGRWDMFVLLITSWVAILLTSRNDQAAPGNSLIWLVTLGLVLRPVTRPMQPESAPRHPSSEL